MHIEGDDFYKEQTWWDFATWIISTYAVAQAFRVDVREVKIIYTEIRRKVSGRGYAILLAPDWLYGVVWPILYVCIAIAATIVHLHGGWYRERIGFALSLYCFNLILNSLWNWVAFRLQRYGVALLLLLCIWATALWTIIDFFSISHHAGFWYLPYLVWLTYALIPAIITYTANVEYMTFEVNRVTYSHQCSKPSGSGGSSYYAGTGKGAFLALHP